MLTGEAVGEECRETKGRLAWRRSKECRCRRLVQKRRRSGSESVGRATPKREIKQLYSVVLEKRNLKLQCYWEKRERGSVWFGSSLSRSYRSYLCGVCSDSQRGLSWEIVKQGGAHMVFFFFSSDGWRRVWWSDGDGGLHRIDGEHILGPTCDSWWKGKFELVGLEGAHLGVCLRSMDLWIGLGLGLRLVIVVLCRL